MLSRFILHNIGSPATIAMIRLDMLDMLDHVSCQSSYWLFAAVLVSWECPDAREWIFFLSSSVGGGAFSVVCPLAYRRPCRRS